MGEHLERHRRAILGLVFAAWLAVCGWYFLFVPQGELASGWVVPTPRILLVAFLERCRQFAPFLGAALLASHAFLRALASRSLGDALEQRPLHLAVAGGASSVFAVFAVYNENPPLAVTAVVAALLLLAFAVRDWAALLALLGGASFEERRGVIVSAPRVVDDEGETIALFEPVPVGYRGEAKGIPVALVPADRMGAVHRLVRRMLVAVVATMAGIMILPIVPRVSAPPPLEGSVWHGDIAFRGPDGAGFTTRAFTLTIDRARSGTLTGVMDWGDVAANVEGTYEGSDLVFYDRSLRRTNGAPFVLNDRKDVRIDGNTMTGTDKHGVVPLHAVRVR